MKKSSKGLITVLPLFVVLFIDGMGLGLLFPILNSLIVDPSSAFLSVNYSAGMRQFLYGFVIAVFMIAWFFGASILGDLSDSLGRKKALIICLLGAAGGYFVSAISIAFHSLFFLIVGRVIAGFTAGSQPIAQAAIVDVSTQETKARNMGFMVLCLSLGFLLGPAIGGVLSHHAFASFFTYATPLYFAAIVSLLNTVFLMITFKETNESMKKAKIKLSRAMEVFISAFKHHRIRSLSGIFLLMIFGWGSYFSFIATFLFHRYNLNSLETALFLSLIAVGFTLGSGVFVGLCNRYLSLKGTITLSYLIACVAALITWAVNDLVFVCVVGVVIGSAISVGYSNILTLFSNQVDSHEQGWVMGVTGSIGAICFGLTSLLSGMISFLGFSAPILIAFFGLAFACIGMKILRLPEAVVTQSEEPLTEI